MSNYENDPVIAEHQNHSTTNTTHHHPTPTTMGKQCVVRLSDEKG
jgi:hypothetical protein